MGGCKSVQTSGCLAASLQKHVQGVHHAFMQVRGAAGRQQGAEFEGFGDAVLVDVCQHVLIPLAAQDDLGVVVVKVDLGRQERNLFIRLYSLEVVFFFLFPSNALHLNTAPLSMPGNGCVYLESAVVKEHHEGAVGLEPLQQVESGHVCVRHATQVPALRKQRRSTSGLDRLRHERYHF